MGDKVLATAIVKLTSVCNLNCTYCYMFNQSDQTFRRVPSRMDRQTAIQVVRRMEEHTADLNRPSFHLVLHGGEPTLWPVSDFRALFSEIELVRRNGTSVTVALQTNGYNIRRELLDLLAEYHVSLGISIDGPSEQNDLHRITHSGGGSYDKVMRTVEKICEWGYDQLLGGFLCVMNPALDPEAFLAWGAALPVKRLDLLWPIEYFQENPPWAPGDFDRYCARPRYGTWLAEVFTRWWERADPQFFIRLFFETIGVLMGSGSHSDALMNDLLNMFVVNTDGRIEYSDYFRAYRDGGSTSPWNVYDHALDEVTADRVFDFCLNLRDHLPLECKPCDHREICGGGFLPGRMSMREVIPTHKSVLCADQYFYFTEVKRLVTPYLIASSGSATRGQS